ncbi:MAG TPA: YidC/Oxa1 family membrane protein insertase [Candidatus Saccharimonadales bacterium]|nr:YidC/Oxa1 family membrane protein insertase [Candidatus Saccharimonadales bacterium]
MFQTFVEQPVFNLLEFIYAIIPGHDLGLAIIIFTIVIRLLMWPLVKKQLHQAKAMKKLQPQLKKIKESSKGDRQKEARLQMELYKEHGVKPFATIGTLIIQLPIFIALYQSVRKLIDDPNILFNFSYDWVNNLPFIQELHNDISKFDHTFFGFVDLSRKAVEAGGLYVPALIVAIAAAITQYYQSKLMMQDNKDSRKLMQILREAAEGKQADQSEIGASISRMMQYFLPFITFIFAISIPSALSLYLLTTSAVGYFQQAHVLKQDEEEMHELAVEAEEKDKTKPKTKAKKAKKPSAKKKRRKR